MKKGLSPLIAVVLLIAVTITVASIIAAFSQSFVSRQTEQFQQTEQSRGFCQFSNIVIQAASYTEGTGAGNASTGSVSAVVSNIGSANLTDFRLNVFYSETSFDKLTPSNAKTVLPQGEFASFQVTGVTSKPVRIQAQSLDCPVEAVYTCVYNENTGRYLC